VPDAGAGPNDSTPPVARRCVLVAPFFPPSGLPPSHRARLYARHLPTFGWTPIVVTVDARDREDVPERALEATVPSDLRVERVRAFPARISRRVGVGDIALRALPALALRTLRIAREDHRTVVVLIVPPWYLLWLAPMLRRVGNVPVVVDYVDPWRVGAPSSRKARAAGWVAAHTEGWSLRRVAGIFAVSDGIITDVRDRFPWLREAPAASAGYGFEQSDLSLTTRRQSATSESEPADRAAGPAGVVRLVYVGALSDSQLPVLESLLDAIVELRERDPEMLERLRLDLYGTTYAPPALARPRTTALVTARDLGRIVREDPMRIPYSQALLLASSAGANLVLGDLTVYYAASKLMPLLAARRPMLALLHADTEPAAALRRLGAAGLVCYGTPAVPSPKTAVPAIAQALLDLLSGRIPAVTSDFNADPALSGRTAERMTGTLAELLDRVADSCAGSR
jgi:hypothetical protein